MPKTDSPTTSEYETDIESTSESEIETTRTYNKKTVPKPILISRPSKPVTISRVKNDSDVIKAIFDAYLTIRITEKQRGWTDVKLGSKNIPSSKDVADKLRAINMLVHRLPDCDVIEEKGGWLDLLTECKKLEIIQHQIKEDTRNSWAGFGKLVTGEEARFEQTLWAIRTYVASRMKSEYTSDDYFTNRKEYMAKEKVSAEQQYNSAKATAHANPVTLEQKRKILEECTLEFDALVSADAASDYHEKFFKEFMHRDTRLDKNGSPLDEDTFEKFRLNVLGRQRTIENLDKLISMEKVLLNPKATPAKGAFSFLGSIFSRSPETAKPKAGSEAPKVRY